jgi:insulysin
MEVKTPLSLSSEYKIKIITLDNGLKAVLVNSTNSGISVCSMSVRVGSYHDPIDTEGLAHFTEHMLFMGTEKYPDENHYAKFLAKNEGFSNAFTSSLSTNYYFSINSSKFFEAMDIFSQFFISPKFDEDSVSREMNAVDSEHSKNIQNDSWREMAVFNKAVNQEHQSSKFSTGNLKTLKHPDIRDRMIKFYYNHYSSDKMKLVVLSNHSLDVIEGNVRKMFSDVVKRKTIKLKIPPVIVYSNLKKNHLYKWIKIKPVSGVTNLNITWYIGNIKEYALKIPEFITGLIGHEYKNSVIYILRHQGYIRSLNISSYDYDPCADFISIRISLTNKGIYYKEFIIKSVFNFIEFVKKNLNKKKYYDELRILLNNSFKFKQKYDEIEFVSLISENIDYVPDEDILYKEYKIVEYTDELQSLINDFFELITPEKAIIIDINSNHTHLDSTEEHYGAEYEINNYYKLDDEIIGLNKFDILEENKYLIKNPQFISKHDDLEPKLLDNGVELWTLSNTSFKTPGIYINIKLIPLEYDVSNIRNTTIVILWVKSLFTQLYDILYLSLLGGYLFELKFSNYSFTITFGGYSDKIIEYINFVLTYIKTIKIEESYFNNSLEDMETNLNFKYDSPYSQAFEYLSNNLENYSFMPQDIYDESRKIKITDLDSLWDKIIVKNNVKILISGNTTPEYSLKISEELMRHGMTSKKVCYSPDSFNNLKDKCKYEIINYKNEKDTNHATLIYYKDSILYEGRPRTTEEIKSMVMMNIISTLISEPFFNQLRTKEQLGYIVKCKIQTYGSDLLSSYGIIFIVQSTKMNATELKKRIMKFIKDYLDNFEKNITEDEIKETSQEQAKIYKEPFMNMDEMNYMFYKLICSQVYQFNYRELYYNEYMKITKKDIITKMNEIFNQKPYISMVKSKN